MLTEPGFKTLCRKGLDSCDCLVVKLSSVNKTRRPLAGQRRGMADVDFPSGGVPYLEMGIASALSGELREARLPRSRIAPLREPRA